MWCDMNDNKGSIYEYKIYEMVKENYLQTKSSIEVTKLHIGIRSKFVHVKRFFDVEGKIEWKESMNLKQKCECWQEGDV